MKYNYAALYNKNAAFFLARPKLKKALCLFNRLATYLFLLAYPLLLGYAIFHLSPKEVSGLLFAPALALLGVTLLRFLIARPRPYEQAGAGITPLEEKESTSSSFPSRHLTSAAVIAACFLPYFPIAGGILLALGVGLGYARFAIGWHYPSDLFAGLLLGLACGGTLFLF